MIFREVFGDKLIISFKDTRRLNLLNIQAIEDYLLKELGNGVKYLYLNMKGIMFIDSFSYGRLIALKNASILFSTEFKLFNASEELEEIFGLLNKSNQLQFVNTEDIYDLKSA